MLWNGNDTNMKMLKQHFNKTRKLSAFFILTSTVVRAFSSSLWDDSEYSFVIVIWFLFVCERRFWRSQNETWHYKMSALCTISSKIDWVKMCTIFYRVSFTWYFVHSVYNARTHMFIQPFQWKREQAREKTIYPLIAWYFCWINLHLYSVEKVYFVEKFIHKTSTLICLTSCNRNSDVVRVWFIRTCFFYFAHIFRTFSNISSEWITFLTSWIQHKCQHDTCYS